MKKFLTCLSLSLLLLSPSLLRAGDKKDVAVGDNHALVLKTDGTLWAFGRNSYGQLGDGTENWQKTPVKIMDNVVQISAQDNKSMALKADGTLWTWGENDYGSLGDGTRDEHSTPKKIMDNVMSACVGDQQSFAVDRDGWLWAWGNNSHGQLGDGTTTDHYTPVRIMSGAKDVTGGAGTAFVVCQDGSLYQLSPGLKSPRKIMEGVVKASCYGPYMALRRDGTLWTWGYNGSGELGDGTTESRYDPSDAYKIMSGVTDFSSGYRHAMAVRKDGTLWAWGWNNYGQLGNGTTTGTLRPIQIDDNVSSVSCGYAISAWITRDGDLRMVGRPF